MLLTDFVFEVDPFRMTAIIGSNQGILTTTLICAVTVDVKQSEWNKLVAGNIPQVTLNSTTVCLPERTHSASSGLFGL